ncbi:MAG: FolC bifunctional protein [Parcubacteria group bacterium GW2011_GWA2_36_10]|nr:MAG: FolC bifunctional protein [Parcubacteria group bacterium GW2011_GWA2_36_10]
MASKINIYHQDVAWLEGLANIKRKNYLLGPKSRKIFIIRLQKFLDLVANPEKKLKFIHVTGTAGKGSTVNLLQNMLIDAGFKVGSYTSPFATTTIEKFRVNHHLIDPKILHDILNQQIKPALDKYVTLHKTDVPSYFELCTTIALLYAVREKCDWMILEAGLGGRHDATNVIPAPVVSAITNIGLDHTEILGPTKKDIATDKAGVIKKSSYFLTSETDQKLVNIFKKTCAKKRAKFIALKNLAQNIKGGQYFSTPKQKTNLNLVLNILEVLNIQPKNPQEVINNFHLICRQEIIQTNPRVILDGAHNVDKLNNLIEFIKTQKYQKLHLIFGAAEDKHYLPALKKLLPQVDFLYLTRFDNPFRKSASLKTLFTQCEILTTIKISVWHDSQLALESALKNAKPKDLVVVTGSFFLAGSLREHWIDEEQITQKLKTK